MQPIAPHFAETAEVLQRGKMKLTAAGGGYGDGIPYQSGFTGGAGAVRLREGVGARQELGAEVYVALYDQPVQYVWGAKLEWKGSPVRGLAFLAGLSAMSEGGSPAVGYDLGFVLSPVPDRWRAKPYLGMRATLTQYLTQRDDPNSDEIGPQVALILALGCEVKLTRIVDLYFEGAPFWHWDWAKRVYSTATGPMKGDWQESGGGPRPNGGYGALGLAFRLN